jgi:hypothetical protein
LTAQCLARAERRGGQTSRLEDLSTECRYPAIRCAALAGCGIGKEGAKLKEVERTRYRKLAREWLQADLTVWSTMLEGNSRGARNLAKKMLMQWQVDPDLAGLREPSSLDHLHADERKDFLSLWDEVANVLKSIG